jgi:hypothetical protein
MCEKTTTTTRLAEQAIGCPDDCNLDHRVAVFARRQGVDTATVYRWKKKGLPLRQTPLGQRINCKQAREFMRGESTS